MAEKRPIIQEGLRSINEKINRDGADQAVQALLSLTESGDVPDLA